MIIFLHLIMLSGMAIEHLLAIICIVERHWGGGDQDLNKNRTKACFLQELSLVVDIRK